MDYCSAGFLRAHLGGKKQTRVIQCRGRTHAKQSASHLPLGQMRGRTASPNLGTMTLKDRAHIRDSLGIKLPHSLGLRAPDVCIQEPTSVSLPSSRTEHPASEPRRYGCCPTTHSMTMQEYFGEPDQPQLETIVEFILNALLNRLGDEAIGRGIKWHCDTRRIKQAAERLEQDVAAASKDTPPEQVAQACTLAGVWLRRCNISIATLAAYKSEPQRFLSDNEKHLVLEGGMQSWRTL